MMPEQTLHCRVLAPLILSGDFLTNIAYSVTCEEHVSPVVVSAILVFPSHKNNVYMLSKVYCYFVWERKFLAVRRVGLMTNHEYRVDHLFPVT